MLTRFNPFARARAAELNSARLSGKLIELTARDYRLSAEVIKRGTALLSIVQTIDNVARPNGTSIKVLRIAADGIGLDR